MKNRQTSTRKRKARRTTTAAADEQNNNVVLPPQQHKKPTAVVPSKNNHPHKFLLILSPAKTMDTTTPPTTTTATTSFDNRQRWTLPDRRYASKTNALIAAMKQQLSPSRLSKLLGISTNLALIAAQYWQDIEFLPESDNHNDITTTNQHRGNHAKPAIYTFQGAAYQGLDIQSLSSSSSSSSSKKKNHDAGNAEDDDDDTTTATIREYEDYLQEHLRIIDPLYGSLRPMDVMQPYRLEMATRNVLPGISKLQDYWRDIVMASITSDSSSTTPTTPTTIVNVASDEYASVLSLYEPQIKVVFQHGGRVIAMHAKRARGLFVRYCALNQATSLQELQGFDLEGYVYQPKVSSPTKLVFDRPANYQAKPTKPTKQK